MNRKSRKKQESKSSTMEKLQSVRLELKKIETDIEQNRQRQEKVRKAYADSKDDDEVVIRAQAYLENSGMPDSQVSFLEEARALADTEAILRQAFRIKNAELQSLMAKASKQHKEMVMPDFIECLQKKIKAIKDYEQAWREEKKIRETFSDKGLNDNYIPSTEWPGIMPSNFRRQQQALQHRLDQMNLGHILK